MVHYVGAAKKIMGTYSPNRSRSLKSHFNVDAQL